MSVNQLIEKALSTSSEEEAIACLRMARKRRTGKESIPLGDNTEIVKLKNEIAEWRRAAIGWRDMYKMADERADSYKAKMDKMYDPSLFWWVAIFSSILGQISYICFSHIF